MGSIKPLRLCYGTISKGDHKGITKCRNFGELRFIVKYVINAIRIQDLGVITRKDKHRIYQDALQRQWNPSPYVPQTISKVRIGSQRWCQIIQWLRVFYGVAFALSTVWGGWQQKAHHLSMLLSNLLQWLHTSSWSTI